MSNIDKALEGLRAHRCNKPMCEKCPYDGADCLKGLLKDAEDIITEINRLKKELPPERPRNHGRARNDPPRNTTRNPPTTPAMPTSPPRIHIPIEPLGDELRSGRRYMTFSRFTELGSMTNPNPALDSHSQRPNRPEPTQSLNTHRNRDNLLSEIRTARERYVRATGSEPDILQVSPDAFYELSSSREFEARPSEQGGAEHRIYGMRIEPVLPNDPLRYFRITRRDVVDEEHTLGSGENVVASHD